MTFGPNNVRMCNEYYQTIIYASTMKQVISIGLSSFNYVLRYVVTMAVLWVGYKTNTAVLERITRVTFYCYLFNSAFLLLLVNADLTEQPFPTWGFNKGSNADFNSNFFGSIGNTLIASMIYTAYYPLVEVLLYYGIRLFFRWWDRGWTCDTYKTKCTSISQYRDLYSGSVFYMYYKYSTMLNVTFVTFMYGFGLPLLFPVAALCMIVLYFVEKTSLYYNYRTPPMYDQKLSEMVFGIMQAAPIFYCAFGYWMCSSKQLLSNDHISPKEFTNSTPLVYHTYPQVFTAQGWQAPAWPLLLMAFIFTFTFFFGAVFKHIIQKRCKNSKLNMDASD